MKRAQQDLVSRDLSRKMVFLTGPRQVGKTSLALAIAEKEEQSVYLNYDNFSHRDVIRRAAWLPETRLLILDELHKMDNWENYLKGIYDTKEQHLQILVTGSARLETKLSDSQISPTLRYFHKRYGIPAIQLVKNLRLKQVIEGIEQRKASRYLRNLEM